MSTAETIQAHIIIQVGMLVMLPNSNSGPVFLPTVSMRMTWMTAAPSARTGGRQ